MTDAVPQHRTRPVLAVIAAIIAVPVLVLALYTAAALRVDYSAGQRAGILQKFSRRGWICKTWEGELAMTTVPGVAPTLWEFSVRDAAAADNVSAAVGKRVVLHYREHRGLPTRCFGETGYFVDSVAIATP
ncbi:MAG TPA: hypothetical protein VHW65_01215 [Gemmatimonadales bacterium]|jgi:hypothetical protein|nr:hypothetical protein [Gemmatimonadales bacterium]